MARRIPLRVRLALWLVLLPLPGFAGSVPITLGATHGGARFYFSHQTVAALPDGGFAVLWEAGSLRMQWVRPDGSFVFPRRGLVVTSSTLFVVPNAIVARPGGGVFVAFERPDEDEGKSHVYVQSFDGEGRRLWPELGVPVAPAREDSQFGAFLLPDAEGGVFACFQQSDLNFTSRLIWASC